MSVLDECLNGARGREFAIAATVFFCRQIDRAHLRPARMAAFSSQQSIA